MDTFEDRQKAFENKFKHDEELAFRATSRTNKRFGLWVAKELGLPEAEAQAYARDLASIYFDHSRGNGGVDAVVSKVMEDVKARKSDLSEHRVRKHYDELHAQVRQEIMNEG